MLRPKKVGTLPVEGSDEQKRTNEIGMAIPLLKTCDIAGKDITGDALLTQRAIATYLVEQQAHYHLTVKSNQPALEQDIALLFQTRGDPDFVETAPPDHGRIETRRIWCSTALNAYLDFPHVGQAFLIERESIDKKTGVSSWETALGITSRTPKEASPKRVLAVNRGIGASKAFITSSTGTTMRIAAESEQAPARKTSLASAALPWAFSNRFKSPPKLSPK